MPIKLCIKCGFELHEHSFCLLCNESIQWACPHCLWKSDQQIHFDCWKAKFQQNDIKKDYECTMILSKKVHEECKTMQFLLSIYTNKEILFLHLIDSILKFTLNEKSKLEKTELDFLTMYLSGRESFVKSFLDDVLISAKFSE